VRVVAARCDAGYIALQLPLSWRERSTRERWGKGAPWGLKIATIMPTLLEERPSYRRRPIRPCDGGVTTAPTISMPSNVTTQTSGTSYIVSARSMPAGLYQWRSGAFTRQGALIAWSASQSIVLR